MGFREQLGLAARERSYRFAVVPSSYERRLPASNLILWRFFGWPLCGKFRRLNRNFLGKAGRADVSGKFPKEAGQAAAVSGNFHKATIDSFRRDEKLCAEIQSASCS
ncbi:hypothetical protein Nepgr_001338 [Nepenthes gracilis]|uniref:Uncharacterized protein n=1 Tax=Nepenthes gracilis TaxID=150966 RepID=A0AAD3P829_NEPGR|nr:hypothetical protein Nepgr_001338 [Nepenthes gracilis]